MKRLISILLALALCVTPIITACAMSIDEGTEALRTQWSRGVGPKVNDWDIDYSYYSPVENGADSSKQYPLIIFMAGALEGQYEGKELDANNVADLTAEEYQSRFTNGGAFILIPRAPEEDSLYWDQSELTPSLFAAIDDFVQSNPNIDTSKIINAGWCLGGTGAINLACCKPEYFAGTVIMCPSRSLTTTEAETLANNNLWFISCKNDSYSNFYSCNYRSWLMMKAKTNNKSAIRLTTFTDAPDTRLVPQSPFIWNHDVWSIAAKDMEDSTDYEGLTTIDGNTDAVENSLLSAWVNSVTNDGAGGAEVKVNFIVKIIEKIYIFMQEKFKASARLTGFDMLTVYYKAMGWL